MNVIAIRDKTYGVIVFILGIIFLVISMVLFNVSTEVLDNFDKIILIIVSVFLLVYGFCELVLPKVAVVQKGEYLYIKKLFSVKAIKLSTLIGANYSERGDFWDASRHEIQYWISKRKDVRTVTITYLQNGSVTNVKVRKILHASQAVLAIRSMIKK